MVDFVGRRLREGVRERETQSLGALLETVCEEVSWGGVGWGGAAKMLGMHICSARFALPKDPFFPFSIVSL